MTERPYFVKQRRKFIQGMATAGGALVLGELATGCASTGLVAPMRRSLIRVQGEVINLDISETRLMVAGKAAIATTINGGIPGPELRLKEGENVTIRVHNSMSVDTSLHWHGVLLPTKMDGVPGLSFEGIKPGETYEYKFPLIHNGTYWYHSHSGFQEQTGTYGSIVVEPKEPEPHQYQRDYTLVLADWTYDNPHKILANLKKYGGYYNFQRRTLENLGEETKKMGFWKALGDRATWARMRMDSTDIADITGANFTYLVNGLSPTENWLGKFSPGETIRLRFINAGAATSFDVRIPGMNMVVIQADGMNVEPVEIHEFRLANAETIDVLITPKKAAYTIFAEAMDRSGFARATIGTQNGAAAPIPARRRRALLTMRDMGMDMKGDMSGMDMKGNDSSEPQKKHNMSGMDMKGMPLPKMRAKKTSPSVATKHTTCDSQSKKVARHKKGHHGAGNSMVAQISQSRTRDPGLGLRDAPWKVLTYSDLRSTRKAPTLKEPTREVELHLTGNMERYMWSFNGKQFDKHTPPIRLKLGERVRFILINDTMMAHPIHIHGMFFELEIGGCALNPLKHTVNVQPAARETFVVEPGEIGLWAFHCHILYHMDAGMFRVIEVVA